MYNCIYPCKFIDFSSFSQKLSFRKTLMMRLLSEGGAGQPRFELFNYVVRTFSKSLNKVIYVYKHLYKRVIRFTFVLI